MLTWRLVVGMVSVCLIVLGTDAAFSQDWPNKPIRIFGGNPASPNDVLARLLAQAISGPLGQPVIVENRANVLAIDAVSKGPPDGYTMIITGPVLWLAPLVSRSASYDPLKDFSPMSWLTREAQMLVVHPSLPVKSVKDLIALAKTRPGELNFAMGAPGGLGQLAGELFKSMAGVKMVGIAFNGNAFSNAALFSGEVQMTFDSVNNVGQFVKAGRLKALAVCSLEPSVFAPGLPTVAATLPGFELVGMGVLFAPPKTPEAIIRRLHQEIVRVLNRSDVKEKLFSIGLEPVGNSPEQFAALIKSEMDKWGKVIKDAGIKVD